MRMLFAFLAALTALWCTQADLVAQEIGPDSLGIVADAAGPADAAAVGAAGDAAEPVAAVLPLPAPPAVQAGDIGGARVVVIATDADAIRAVGQLRDGVHARDWGVVVGVGCLLVVFLIVRLVLPHLHGTTGVRIVAGIAGLCGYVGAQVGPGSSVEDIIATVIIGAVLAGAAVWSPPAAGGRGASGTSGAGGSVLGLLLVGSTALLVGTGCATITPAVQAGGDVVTTGYTRYVRADGALSETQRDERIEVACNHRRLLGLDVPADCPAVGGVR